MSRGCREVRRQPGELVPLIGSVGSNPTPGAMDPWMGILLWFAVFMGGSILGGLCPSRNAKIGAGCTSTVFIILSLMVFQFTGGFEYYGLKIDVFYTVISIFTAFLVAFPLSLIASRVAENTNVRNDPFDFGNLNIFEFSFLLLLLAPLGEELLFRGVLESSLLEYGILIATIIPALLFSLIHFLPFRNTPRKFLAIILISAFILGLLTGYFRAISGSLLPAYVTHAIFNLNGKIAERLTCTNKETVILCR